MIPLYAGSMLSSLLFAMSLTTAELPPVKPVSSVDLDRYHTAVRTETTSTFSILRSPFE